MSISKIKSGIKGLDILLDGGFIEKDAILISGAPGTGKSTIGLEFLIKGCKEHNEPGIYISFEEFPEQLYRDAKELGWDLKELEDTNKLSILFTSPAVLLEDLQNSEGIITEMASSMHAKRIVIDSITAFSAVAEDKNIFREMVYLLINAIKREGLTALLLREQLIKEENFSAEEYTCDTHIFLDNITVEGKQNRILKVTKSRGSNSVLAEAYFFITRGGVEVIVPFTKSIMHYDSILSTGSKELDYILGSGLPSTAFYMFTLSGINQFFPTFKHQMIKYQITHEQVVVEFSTTEAQYKNLMENPNTPKNQFSLVGAYKRGDILSVTMPTSVDDLENFKNIMEMVGERTPVFLDISYLYATVQDTKEFLTILNKILEIVWQHKSLLICNVCEHLPSNLFEILINTADGVINVWNEAGATYLKIEKSLNRIVSLPYFVVDNGIEDEMEYKI